MLEITYETMEWCFEVMVCLIHITKFVLSDIMLGKYCLLIVLSFWVVWRSMFLFNCCCYTFTFSWYLQLLKVVH